MPKNTDTQVVCLRPGGFKARLFVLSRRYEMPKESSAEVKTQRERMGRGEQLEAGWCFDPDRDPDVFRCGELEKKVAEGKVSVSFDGARVMDLESGQVTLQKARPMNVGTMTTPNAPATGADTATTDNAAAGTGGGGRAART
jgi:hypothetical protein